MTETRKTTRTDLFRCLPILAFFCFTSVLAGPNIPAGDVALRHDIQRLADYGIIEGTVTTWPLAWGPILHDIRNADATELPSGVGDALARIRQRASWETRSNELTCTPIRSRTDHCSSHSTPRSSSSRVSWVADRALPLLTRALLMTDRDTNPPSRLAGAEPDIRTRRT